MPWPQISGAFGGQQGNYGLNTTFGYGPEIPYGNFFNQALSGMVGELGQDVSSFTTTPAANQAADQYAGGLHQAARQLPARGITGMPQFEDALAGNYQQALLGIPPAGAAAQTAFRQQQLANLTKFPADVAGSYAGEQSAHLRERDVEDAQQRALYNQIGQLVHLGESILLPGGLGQALGGTMGKMGPGIFSLFQGQQGIPGAIPGSNIGMPAGPEAGQGFGFPNPFTGNNQYPGWAPGDVTLTGSGMGLMGASAGGAAGGASAAGAGSIDDMISQWAGLLLAGA